MLPRTRAKAALVSLAVLAIPASCTQILGLAGDYTLDEPTSSTGGAQPTGVGSGGDGGGAIPEMCADEIQNGDETALDCGGPRCPRCAIDLGCEQGSDCVSGLCTAKQCACPEGAVPDASGACVCAAVALLCASGCEPLPVSTFVLDSTDADEEAIGPSVAALPDGTFGLSWVRAFSKEVVFGTVLPNDTIEAAVESPSGMHSSSSLTAAVSGTSFVLSTILDSNVPGHIRTYVAGGGGISGADNVIDLYDSDRIDCARVKTSDVRCVFYHPDPPNIPTVQSVRFDPATPGVTPAIDLNPEFLLNASDLAFPAIASDGTRSLMVWRAVASNAIRFAIDDGNSVAPDDDLMLGALGQVGRVDVAWHSPEIWIVTWAEAATGEAPFEIGIAAVDDAGGVISQTAIPLEDGDLVIDGPVSIAIGPTPREASLGAISYAVVNPRTSARAIEVLYVDLSAPATLSAETSHTFVTIASPDSGGALESPALVFHPSLGLGLGLLHYAASTEETVELYRLPVCDLFVPE